MIFDNCDQFLNLHVDWIFDTFASIKPTSNISKINQVYNRKLVSRRLRLYSNLNHGALRLISDLDGLSEQVILYL
jgi:hypothetical protein